MDAEGKMLAAGGSVVPSPSPLVAKADALLVAISIATDKGWGRVWLESYSNILIHSLVDLEDTAWPIQNLVQDIRALSTSFHFIHFDFVNRPLESSLHATSLCLFT